MLHANRNARVTIESGLHLSCRLSIKGPGSVRIGKRCTIHGIPGARVNMVTLYTHDPEATIAIGQDAVLVAARFSSRFAIDIGNAVVIEDASLLDTDFHSLDRSRRVPADETLEQCRITVGDEVSIGSRAIIGKGVSVGKGSVVHPGSVVQKSFPDHVEIMGNPARIVDKH